MVTVRFPRHLIRHCAVPAVCEAEAATVSELIQALDRRFPGVASYLVHEDGSLRQHVNIFLGERLIRDRQRLSDPLDGVAEVFVMQALSGG